MTHIRLTDFKGNFGYASEPNGFVGSSRIYPPGYQKLPKYDSAKYSVEPCAYTVDYINGNLDMMCYWQQPQKDVGEHIHKVVYKIIYKIGSIKKIIEKIEREIFQVYHILLNAEKELKYLKYVFLKLDTKQKKCPEFHLSIKQKFYTKYQHYVNLREYYIQLPGIKRKYEQLIEAIKTRKKCFTCFKSGKKEKLVIYKKKVLCQQCLKKDEARRTRTVMTEEECDCPVCLETFKRKEMIETACGGGHWICSPCTTILRIYRSDCPMCRGALV